MAWIVTEPQVTMLKPWRGRPHVYIDVEAQVQSAQMLISRCLASTNPYLSCLVVTDPLSPSKKQVPSESLHTTDLIHLHTLNQVNKNKMFQSS